MDGARDLMLQQYNRKEILHRNGIGNKELTAIRNEVEAPNQEILHTN